VQSRSDWHAADVGAARLKPGDGGGAGVCCALGVDEPQPPTIHTHAIEAAAAAAMTTLR